MSTNYYAFGDFPGGETTDPDGNACEGLHIGQAAGGWRFQFRSWPDLGLTTYQAWRDFLRQPGVTIKAESGYTLTFDQMDATLTEARDSRGWPLKGRVNVFHIPDGYHLDGPHTFCVREFF